ncbi:esterase/lipase family protein [Floridanema evergladense]|uniref:Esterase/lipase family protein n=1 Tax=Floridaenema evergladense BLCC-F167 TaxID=3153639 RepID=A0ABV4WMA5_9CYAN
MNSTTKSNPVLLVHGMNDTAAVFYKMAPELAKKGWTVHDIDLTPNNCDRPLDYLAKQIVRYVEKTFPPEQPIDIVGFSMGGIVSRYYIQRLGGIDRVQRFITVSSPHHGTVLAYLIDRPGSIQMRPDSPFLADLNRDLAMLEQINFTSIWTPFDLMIVPPTSSRMPVGKDVQVPIPFHAWMISDPKGIAAVAEALAEPLRQHHPLGQTPPPQKLPKIDSNI